MSASPPKGKQNVADIASIFGGMAKMKKVKTPRRHKKSKKELADIYAKEMAKLKHVDDSNKNLFASTISSDNVFDYNLRHKNYANRENSPMPPKLLHFDDGEIPQMSLTENRSRKEIPFPNSNSNQLLGLNEFDTHNKEDIGITDNNTPKSVKAHPLQSPMNKHTSQTSYSHSNEDTEIDDISSERSHSNKAVITITKPNPNNVVNDPIVIVTENDVRLSVPEPSDDGGMLNSDMSSDFSTDYSSNTDTLSDSDSDSENDGLGVLNHSSFKGKSKHFRNISLNTSESPDMEHITTNIDYTDLFGDDGQLMIGKITTPTYRKKQEIKAKQHPRAQTATDYGQWNYDELFGNDENGDIIVGAIKTPTFKKKSEKKESKPKARLSDAFANTFDLSDILGNDYEMDMNNVDRYDTILESEEQSFFAGNDFEYETESEESDEEENGYFASVSMPVSPEAKLPPLEISQHIKNISVSSVSKILKIFESSDSEDFEPEPAMSKFEVEKEKIDTITAEIDADLDREKNDKAAMQRRQNKRATQIHHDLEGMFDMSDEESLSRMSDVCEMEKEDNEPLGNDDKEMIMANDDFKINVHSPQKKELERVRLKDLMLHFKIKKKVIKYFTKELKIKYETDLFEFAPSQITQPTQFKSTQTRMLLSKMCKFVSKKYGEKGMIVNRDSFTNKQTQWTAMYNNENKVSYTFSPNVPIETQSKATLKKQIAKMPNFNLGKTKQIQIKQNNTSFVDKTIQIGHKYSAQFNIDEFPEMLTKSKFGVHSALCMGVNFYNSNHEIVENVYISDRCAIYRNEKYLDALSLSNSQMLENDSQIFIELHNKATHPCIIFKHLRNNVLMEHNKKSIVLTEFTQGKHGFAKIYIEQHYGNGMYSIQRQISRQNSIKDFVQTQMMNFNSHSSMASNIGSRFRRSNKHNKSQSLNQLKGRKHRASV